MDRISFLERAVRGLLLTLIVVFFLFPIFWILLMSFQTNEQILRIPPSLTFVPTLDNYKALISGHLVTSAGTLDIAFMRNLGNSVGPASRTFGCGGDRHDDRRRPSPDLEQERVGQRMRNNGR